MIDHEHCSPETASRLADLLEERFPEVARAICRIGQYQRVDVSEPIRALVLANRRLKVEAVARIVRRKFGCAMSISTVWRIWRMESGGRS